jgi:hypothetical protein
MQWTDEKDKIAIYKSAEGQEYLRQILLLVEAFAQEFNDHGNIVECQEIEDRPYSPDQIANALLLLVTHFDEGDRFFESLSWVEKTLVRFQYNLTVEELARIASQESHKGEGDESLSDSQ